MGHESDRRRPEKVVERSRKIEAQHHRQAIQQSQIGTTCGWQSAAAETTLATVPIQTCWRYTSRSVDDMLLFAEQDIRNEKSQLSLRQ